MAGQMRGETTQNRHFILDKHILGPAREKAREEGVGPAEVLRAAIRDYARGTTDEMLTSNLREDRDLPEETVEHIRRVWQSGDQHLINGYFSALVTAGWRGPAIAKGLIATGLVGSTFSRQAMSLRLKKAPNPLPSGLPAVPRRGLRRLVPLHRDSAHDFSFQVADADYEKALHRAHYEDADIPSVLEEYLTNYLAGEFSVKPRSADQNEETAQEGS